MEDSSQKPDEEEELQVPLRCPQCGSVSVKREVLRSVVVQESYTEGVLRDTSTVSVRVLRSSGTTCSTQWTCVPEGHTWYDPPRRGTLSIEHDDDPMSPRDYDNLGTMVCFHKRYNLGDETDLRSSMFEGWDELRKHLEEEEEALHVLPLYLMDHSGLSIGTKPFGCQWDSGQVGFVFTTAKRMVELGVETKDVEQVLVSETQVYDQYLQGDIWGFVLKDTDGETIDSCYGFYGQKEAYEAGEEAARAEKLELIDE